MKREVSPDAKYVEITTRADFLPERQKTTILVGVRIDTDSPVRIKLWRSENFLCAVTDEGSMTKNAINDQGSEQRMEVKVLPLLVLASDGIAAEYRGGQLGQYIPSGEHNKSTYYIQSSTLSESESRPVYLYRAEDNQWWVNDVLGERRGGLRNPSSAASVPETGWKVYDGLQKIIEKSVYCKVKIPNQNKTLTSALTYCLPRPGMPCPAQPRSKKMLPRSSLVNIYIHRRSKPTSVPVVHHM